MWSKSIVIIDEYDWLFFEGNAVQMQESIKIFKLAYKVIGITGSTLTASEEIVIKNSFN